MSAGFLAPAAQAGAFVLGCVLIHAARGRAAALTRWLAGVAAVMAALTVIVAGLVWAPDDLARFDEITVYAAFAGQQPRDD